MGVKEWTIVIGVILGVTVLLWMAARWRKRRYDDIYSYDPAESEAEDSDYGAELPSGGARTVGYRDPSDIEAMNDEIRKRADDLKPRLSSMPSAPKEQQPLFEEPAEPDDATDEQVPLLLDPSEEHSETVDTEPPVSESLVDDPSVDEPPVEEPPVEDHLASNVPHSDDVEPDSQPVTKKIDAIDQHTHQSKDKVDSETSLKEEIETSEEVSEPEADMAIIPDRDDSPATKIPDTPSLKPAESHAVEVRAPKTSAPEVRAPEVSASEARMAESRAAEEKKASPNKEKLSRRGRKKAAAAEAAPKEPPEIIIVNLMTSPETPYEGKTLLRGLTELGMRFGDMDIFHYCGKHGDEEPQFRMANLLNPGVFDIEKFDELRTHALCFFFELEPELDNMSIYESMLSVISRLKDELGGEMRDDQRSVFTIQMSEHCRNRIRDFQRRHLVKTS